MFRTHESVSLLNEWSKDYLRATVMLTDVQRVQLLPSYVCRTKGEKNLAESVSEETDFNKAISEIKRFIDPKLSHIQLTKQFFDVQRAEDDDCTSIFFELYNKGTDAEVSTDMIFKRFLTLFKGSDKFYDENAAAIKVKTSKAESTTLFGNFKEQLDKKRPAVVVKEEPEESYAITHDEQKPVWAKDLQDQLNSMQSEIRDQRNGPGDSSESADSVKEEVYHSNKGDKFKPKYENSGSNQPPKQAEQCKICQGTGHTAENATKGSVRIVMVKDTVTLSALAKTTARIASTTKESKHDYIMHPLYRSLRGEWEPTRFAGQLKTLSRKWRVSRFAKTFGEIF